MRFQRSSARHRVSTKHLASSVAPSHFDLSKEPPALFLRSLWQMCCEETGDGTIRWGKPTIAHNTPKPCDASNACVLPADESGSRVIIKSHSMMESKVLSKTPGSKSFTGFQRQLNYFGFRRVFGGKTLPGKQTMYSNPLFRRDHPEELAKIQRQDKGKRKCTPALPEKEQAEAEVESPMVEGQLCEQSMQPQGLPPPAESGEPLSWTSTGMALGDGACAEMGLCGSGWCVVV